MKKLTLMLLYIFSTSFIFSQNLNEELSNASLSIIGQLTTNGKFTTNKISCLFTDFSNQDGKISALGKTISNKLQINIIKDGGNQIQIANRSILDKVLAEEQLFKDGIINPETAKKIKFQGVEVLIIGEIFDFGTTYSIDIQLIDTETSNLLGGESIEIAKSDYLVSLYGKTGNSTKVHKTPGEPIMSQEKNGFRIEILSVIGNEESEQVHIKGLVTRIEGSRAFTSRKNEVSLNYMHKKRYLSGINYGGCSSKICTHTLHEDSPLVLNFKFNGIEKNESEALRDFRIGYTIGSFAQTAFRFKNLPITWE